MTNTASKHAGLSPEEHARLKQEKIKEREDALEKVRAERAMKLEQRQIAEVESLDEDDPDDRTSYKSIEVTAAPASPTKVRKRHWGVILSFVVMVLVPLALSAWYLWTRAADRYVSQVGFSVRMEETSSAVELLGGFAEMSGSSTADTDILYKFIQSQQLIETIDQDLDLRALWAKGDPDVDFVFSYDPPGTIEDLVSYWPRMVKVYNDSGTGLIDLQVQAFTPSDAQQIAMAIFEESSAMINRLSAIARDDATRYAKDELAQAVERLKTTRAALTQFRNQTQIVDPVASIQTQMGLLSSLQMQLATALIDLDILRQTTLPNDPRISQIELRVEVIRGQIEQERNKLGLEGTSPETEEEQLFSELIGRYEELTVEQNFAETAYVSALAAYDGAIAEAQRQSRYLAAHIQPTLAESSVVPNRPTLLALLALFSIIVWGVTVLIYYALKDRR